MKEKINNVLTKIKNLDKKHLTAYLLVFGCAILFLGTSYAWFTKTDILKNFQIVVSDLTYTLQSDALNSSNQVTVPAGETLAFDILVTSNNAIGTKYQMVYSSSNDLTNVEVGYNTETVDTSSGGIVANGTKTISVVIKNKSASSVTIQFNVRGGTRYNKISDIILASAETRLDTGLDVYEGPDIIIAGVTIDGEEATSLPTSGTYTLSSYNCKNNSSLTWNTYTKSITFGAKSSVQSGESCTLNFTKNTNYPLLIDIVKQGDYIAYEGNNGCLKNGTTTASIPTGSLTAYDENSNSCLGYNANANTDGTKDSTYGMYGYCPTSTYRYYESGWRIAYTDGGRVYIVSGGSPECNTRTSIAGNTDYITAANISAKKYCNSSFVDDCTSDTDAHAINDTDYNKITAQLTGTTGGYLYTSITGATQCGDVYSNEVCGYNNDLIDNGGYYWFAAAQNASSNYGVYWDPNYRQVTDFNYTYGYGLRPVIRLSSGVYITGGAGTMDDPYIIAKK